MLIFYLLKTVKIHDRGDEDAIDISPEMTTIGKIDVFDETQESWETYVEGLQHFSQQMMSTTIIKCRQLC